MAFAPPTLKLSPLGKSIGHEEKLAQAQETEVTLHRMKIRISTTPQRGGGLPTRSNTIAAIDAIANLAESSAYSPALIEPNGILLSYEDLWARILAVGSRLQDAGIASHETVAVLMPQGARQVLAVTGVLNHCICAPLQPRTNVAEVEVLLRRLAASALIASTEFDLEANAASTMGLTVLIVGDEESPKDWKIHRAASHEYLTAGNSEAILLLVTSATTGGSKVVPLTSTNLDAGISSRRDSLRLTATDRLLQMTSLCHIIGIENTLAQFLVGGAVVATEGFDPTAYLDWLRELRPTWYDCAPTVHQAALAQLRRIPFDRPISLRFVQAAGAPLPGEVRQELEQILHVPVLNDYGMTEACPIATDAFLPGGPVPNSAGRSCGLQVAVMDPSGELVQSGADGEIVVRGLAVFSGYADDPEANRTAFQNGWFRTGDLGRLDQEGNLFLTGRLKEMINRGGEKILPGEVDIAIASHPAVREAAAFSVPHPTLGEDVACAVVLRASSEPPVSANELRSFAAQQLARFKIPRRIYFIDEIPRGELGKPQRWLLTERWNAKLAAPPSPDSDTERSQSDEVEEVFYWLREIWSRILNRDALGFEEDFFAAGGDSLAAINMLAEVDGHFGSHTSDMAASFLDEPTLAHLAELVGAASRPKPGTRGSSEIRVFPVREAGSQARLFCIPAEGHEGLYFRRLAKHLHGEMDLSIVRPANTWFKRSLFTFKDNGRVTATLIRQAQPAGPYFVAGYCFGGIVAVEAVRQLVLQGEDARLILFDVPMPGFPSLIHNWPALVWAANNKLSELGTVNYAQSASDSDYSSRSLLRYVRWFAALSIVIARRLAWDAAVSARGLLVPLEPAPAVEWVLRHVQGGDLPFFRANPVDAPILHFLCKNGPNMLLNASRLGWRAVAHGGIEERFIALDHDNMFHESNLPWIANTLRRWSCTLQPLAGEADL